jgi:hypothetical protein
LKHVEQQANNPRLTSALVMGGGRKFKLTKGQRSNAAIQIFVVKRMLPQEITIQNGIREVPT